MAPFDAVDFILMSAIFTKSGFSMNSSSIPPSFVFIAAAARAFGFLTNTFSSLDRCNSCFAVSERPIKIPKNDAGFEENPLRAAVDFILLILSSAAFAAKYFFFLFWKRSSRAFSRSSAVPSNNFATLPFVNLSTS